MLLAQNVKEIGSGWDLYYFVVACMSHERTQMTFQTVRYNGMACFYNLVKAVDQFLNVMQMQSCCRFIQDIEVV